MDRQKTQQKQDGRGPGKPNGAASKSGAGELEQSDTGRSGATPRVEGEGSYTGTRRYNESLAKHLETHDVAKEAEEARAALEGEERKELEEAERQGKQGPAGQRQSPKR